MQTITVAPTNRLATILEPYRGSLAFAVATTRTSWSTSARIRALRGQG